MHTKSIRLSIIAILFFLSTQIYSQAKEFYNWSAFKFLLGEWVGEGSGSPGEAAGEFTFSHDLQNAVLIRKSFAEYPAQNGKPAFRHDDLMIVYRAGDSTKANYFDNEGHAINYNVNFSSDSLSVMFISDPNHASPRFRFAYTKIDQAKLKFSFDIAPPGKPEEFSKYIEGVVKKK